MNREEFIEKVDKKLESKELKLFPRINDKFNNKSNTKSDKKTKTK